MSDEQPQSSKPKRQRRPRKISAQYLENSAAHYLGRFATSKAHLKSVMMQKVWRSHSHHGTSMEEGEKWVDDVIAKFERLGYLNDQEYAAMRARSLHARGKPLKGIRFELARKGLSEDDIETALAALGIEENARDLDLAAAVRLARRRRLGPFRSDDADVRLGRREKDLAALARAGFSYDIAKQVVDTETVEELELEIGF